MRQLLFFIALLATVSVTAQTKPFILGEIAEIQSKALGEKRILNIYLPEGYNAMDTLKYPVIYLLDGSADEDFIHISGLVQYCNFPWVNILPKSIVVGIANVDRKRDFSFPTTIAEDKKEFPTTGGSGKFITFIENELQPFIASSYRTSNEKTLIGQSFAGLLATEILFCKPQLFSKYIIISPSLWWDNESLLKNSTFVKTALRDQINVYVGVGNEGDEMTTDAENLAILLKKNPKATVHYEFLENENHATILHQAVYRAFGSFTAKK